MVQPSSGQSPRAGSGDDALADQHESESLAPSSPSPSVPWSWVLGMSAWSIALPPKMSDSLPHRAQTWVGLMMSSSRYCSISF